MSKILIIEATSKRKPLAEDYSDTSIVHCRNSIILKNYLGADLLDGEYKLSEILGNKYDVIVCAYASPYMPHVPYRQILDANPNARLVFLVADHDLEDNQLLRWGVIERGRSYDMICNNPRSGYRHWILNKNIAGKKLNDFIINWHTTNLNTLIFNYIQESQTQDKDGFLYYGTFRKHRAEDFTKYLQKGMLLSTSTKHQKKFDAIGCTAEYIPKLMWVKGAEDLRKFKYSLYIEDKHTHDHFAFMANRFYEAIAADVVTLFAPNTLSTVSLSGYPISKEAILPEGLYKDQLNKYIKGLNFNELLIEQKKLIPTILAEKETTLKGIKNFLS